LELQLRGITKRFPGVLANDRIDLTVRSGEVLGLLGENGAGKTTLMNILYGLYTADEGDILIDGVAQHFTGPGDAIAAGIGMVHQHFMLVPVFTVTENVVLGVEPTFGPGIINFKKARSEVVEISERYSLHVDPDALIENLPVGVQQRVEIIKVLFREARFLVFDEPTAVLTPQEVEEFFGIVRTLQQAGKGIVFITHKLGEVLEISDRIAVLRDGRVVGEALPGEMDQGQLAEMMVGRPVELTVAKAAPRPGEAVLEVSNLVVLDEADHPAVNGVTFQVRSGEIVGIAGVQGNGQTELVRALTGMRAPMSGSIKIAGEEVAGASPRHIHELGTAHVPEDRLRHGLITSFTVAENIVLDSYQSAPFSRLGVMNWPKVREEARELVEQFDVRTPSIEVKAANLSGGNQQKVIVAREFGRENVKLAIASQPTRGLDVGSIEYIHGQIVAQRDRGAAILIVSTELDEVMALSDRLLVMYRGRIVAELDPAQVTPADVGLYMAGATA
jgi:general nucleoside transport system ATP-binding protein